jgi:hypothetical protein
MDLVCKPKSTLREKIKNSSVQYFRNSRACNLFSRRRDSDTHCASPRAITRRSAGIFCTLFQPSFIPTYGTKFALWASRNPGQADFASFDQGNAVNVSRRFFGPWNVLSREREIYARNVTGIRWPTDIFGRSGVKLHVFTLTMQNFARFRAVIRHTVPLTFLVIMPERKPRTWMACVNPVLHYCNYNSRQAAATRAYVTFLSIFIFLVDF